MTLREEQSRDFRPAENETYSSRLHFNESFEGVSWNELWLNSSTQRLRSSALSLPLVERRDAIVILGTNGR